MKLKPARVPLRVAKLGLYRFYARSLGLYIAFTHEIWEKGNR